MKNSLRIIAVVMLWLLPYVLFSQVSYKLKTDKSTVKVFGTSTIHDWEIDVEKFAGELVLAEEKAINQLQSGNIMVYVSSFKSEHDLMDKKTHEALKQKKHPIIKAKLLEVRKEESNLIDVELTIAGVTKQLTDEFDLSVNNDGSLLITGKLDVLMSDFKIDSPTAVMGTIKTGDAVWIEYQLVFNK